MNRAVVIVLLVLAGLALVTWLLWPDLAARRDDPASVGTPTSSSADSDRSASGPGERAAAEALPIRTSPFSEETVGHPGKPFAITGRVVDSEYRPLPGLKVQLRLYDGYEPKGEPLLEVTTTSDADAAFVFKISQPERTATFSAAVVEDDFIGYREIEVVVRGDPPPPPLTLRAWRYDAEVTGIVSDKDSHRIPNATVGWGRDVTTDNEGTYRYRIVTRRGTVWLAARAPGFARKEAKLAPPLPGSTTRMDFVLDPEGTLTGIVRTRAGVPVPEARVFGWTSENVETRTDQSGAFRLHGFDIGREYQFITVEAAGFQRAFIQQMTFIGREAKVEVFLDAGVDLQGVVTGRDDGPVEGAEVRIGKPNFAGTITVRTNAQGRFVFKAVKPGACEIAATRRGYAETMVLANVPEIGQAAEDVHIRLAESQRVGGVVTDSAQTPVQAIHIAARIRGEYAGPRATTDSSGRFSLDDLPAAGLSLEFYGKGWLRAVVEVPQLREDLSFVLQRAAKIEGRVVDSRSRAPIERFRIRIVPPDLRPGERPGEGYTSSWREQGHVFTNADGYWQIEEDLTPGTILGIEASADGFASARDPHVVATTDPAKDAVILELRAAGSISGTAVLEGSGAPVSDATIFVTTLDEEKVRKYDRRWTPIVTARTDSAGVFRLTGVPPGQVHVVADHSEYPEAIIGPLQVAEGEQLDSVRVVISGGAAIEGTCIGLDGKPLAGIAIHADSSTMTKSKQTTTSASGRFGLTGLPAGFLYVTASFGGDYFSSLTLPVTLTAGETKTVTLAMDGPCTLRIDIESAEQLPAQMSVSLRPQLQPGGKPDGRPHRRAPITARGLEISGLAPGLYAVAVDGTGGQGPRLRGTATVTLEASKRSEMKIQVRREP